MRGQGGLSEDTGGVKGATLRGHFIRGLDDTPDNLLFRHIFLDTAELARIVMDMPEVDPDRVCATGASQGGGLTIACAALEPRIRRAFPIYPFLSDYRRVWEMDLAKLAYEELAWYFRSFDPLHAREEEVFTRLGYIDVQHLAPRITAEVRMAVGLMDEICPAPSQFAAYNRVSCPKDLSATPFRARVPPRVEDLVYDFFAGVSNRERQASLPVQPYLFVAPALLVIGLFVLYPVFDLFYLSLCKANILGRTRFIGLDNFLALLTSLDFANSVRATVVFMVVVVIAQTALALGVALLVESEARSIGAVRTIFFIPVVIPFVVASFLWKFIYDPDVGLINSVLQYCTSRARASWPTPPRRWAASS